ncbi:P-loop containing nucleoside triphosphate hydrolase protein [Clohesyomyces aquaticus]|uniref:p-loop containing nucleoside triphosphate hydrolase protein n=1 Tax=Clohesyomyces aquaticus TaxID=1231657 RepID=A0A1Y1YHW0_9PLEO|nr:P-loop containing nucleoside triphosphate hydrolase protein [Clohesyomyces aquaticus]
MEADVVIAVMGMTGVGKSTFIRTITGRDDIVVGHGLISETTEIRAYPYHDGDVSYALVDTPGFDDSFLSNETIATKLLNWLETSYRSGTRLNGIVYLHNISMPRLQGSAFQHLRMFRELCGDDALKAVVLATTFWSEVDATLGEARETELKEDRMFWAKMIEKGSSVMRLELDRPSAVTILEAVASNAKVTLQAQKEMVKDELPCVGTAPLLRMRAEEEKENEEKLDKLRQEADSKAKDIERSKNEVELQLQRMEEKRKNRLQYYKKHKCRCRVMGVADCASCGRLVARVGRVFYRKCHPI